MAPRVRLTLLVRGRVQGVGFRWWTRARATESGLVGWVANRPDGRVEIAVEGDAERCRALHDLLRSPAGPGDVAEVEATWGAPTGMSGFEIR